MNKNDNIISEAILENVAGGVPTDFHYEDVVPLPGGIYVPGGRKS